jgi:OmpA-OmpF porin, OOP family
VRLPWPTRAPLVSSLLTWTALTVACAGSAALDHRVESIHTALRDVEANGAMRCAPRELAVARSHVEFAQLEREQGFVSRAEAHLDVADENVRAARVLGSSARCSKRPDAGTPASPVVTSEAHP